MECAALAAVALFRGVDFAQLLYSGDSLAGPLWDNRGWMEQKELREQVFFLAAGALAAWPLVRLASHILPDMTSFSLAKVTDSTAVLQDLGLV
ncbi:hypothetical protein SDC9_131158 [bioreactor metagenome]|uniref:Uncharacterized protein n=1 Tax=bioreactor metagenome TaxID=1076179 RepID=A0A645D4H8_9ZZZZ